jgi:hypothetical protein
MLPGVRRANGVSGAVKPAWTCMAAMKPELSAKTVQVATKSGSFFLEMPCRGDFLKLGFIYMHI